MDLEEVDCEIPIEERRNIALRLYADGQQRGVSTGIHDYITYGYGDCDFYGFWEYPLPDGEYVG